VSGTREVDVEKGCPHEYGEAGCRCFHWSVTGRTSLNPTLYTWSNKPTPLPQFRNIAAFFPRHFSYLRRFVWLGRCSPFYAFYRKQISL
jgi:hypothetical protein